MKKIIFISDFFLEHGANGGAEQYNNNLINYLSSDYNIEKIRSRDAIADKLYHEHDCFFIVSNFMNLSEACKRVLQNKQFLILEHDHKYVATNDPSKFVDMLAPQEEIINRNFYRSARAIMCQSKKHSEVLQKNLLLDQIINLSCNLWSDKQLRLLDSFSKKEKTIEYSVVNTPNKNKGTKQAIAYCKQKNIEFNLIGHMDYEGFLQELSKTKYLIFFPQWLESFNRLVVEAKILGCKVITNKLLGVASEEWFRETDSSKLVDVIREKRKTVLDTFKKIIENNFKKEIFIEPIEVPKISIITSLYKGGKFIERFMKNITNQTFFNKCELLILDANSPDGEYDNIIRSYEVEHDNIKYFRLKTRIGVQETMNLGLKKSSGEFITLANVDDLRHPRHIEFLSKLLTVDQNIDLVYSDSIETTDPLCEFEEAKRSENLKLYEHSRYIFSGKNMIKCLPGPMPLWRKNLHDKFGYFDENYKFAADWDMWLRAVRSGSKFKKVQEILGLYYNNPDGLSTSSSNEKDRFQEEKEIFNKNKPFFNLKNWNTFEEYFNAK